MTLRAVIISEGYAIRTITGDAVMRRLALSGWGATAAALQTYTDRGRLWWRYTSSGALLEFFRRPTLVSGHRVAYATITAGVSAAFTADNSSGFSGSCEIDNGTPATNPASDSTGDVIVSYADENDLKNALRGSRAYLDANSKWEAQDTRFEAILREAKVELDELLAGRLAGNLSRDDNGRRALAAIADPRQVARIHALYTVAMMERYRVGNSPERREAAEFWFTQALQLMSATQIALDDDGDDQIDREASVASIRLSRA